MIGANIPRPPVQRIIWWQLAALTMLSLAALLVERTVAYSVFSGCIVAIVPQAYFAYVAFRWRGAQSASAVARSAYAGMVGKFVLSAVGFATVFALLRPVEGYAVFVGYLAMLLVQIIGSWLLLRRNR